ncbi:MAG TPA: tRNA1(Val) (adenine(37)-N6)-methyltransferase [Clostridia bacterium]|nr:tRNA1(Val) (adenine(37)-N6)-methyltransferase [Clostridia bacterium]HPQ45901.1 tRNA1(Val) (adenine(37)-N6)-methyltransferase [Clostridia bacterium]HRX41820.1 tRNA1(Val) (adenine(37)-N6)-methyltransferase [Clostridia bacterium]
MLKDNEQLDDLQIKGLRIIQDSTRFKFGTDAVLLSYYAKIKPGGRCIDLGTGTGIIPLLLNAKSDAREIIGLEMQDDLCEMASRSIELNKGIADNIRIVRGDIRQVDKLFTAGSFSNVVSNPPYMKDGSGFQSEDRSIAMSRHEIECTIEDIARAAGYLLNDKGVLTMVHRPNRLVDVLHALRNNSLEPKTIRFVHPYAGKSPNLFLISAVKNSRPFLKMEDPLVIRNTDGSYTDEIYKIYGMDRE